MNKSVVEKDLMKHHSLIFTAVKTWKASHVLIIGMQKDYTKNSN